MDRNGNAVVVWFQSNDNRISHVWATRYSPGHGWETPAQIETEEAVASGIRVATDPDGNAIVTWVQRDFRPDHGSNIWAALYRVGTGWDAPSLIGNDNAFSAMNPRVMADGNGNALAVWEQGDLSTLWTSTLWSNRYTRGAGWGSPELIGPAAGDSNNPEVAVDPTGNGLVVWSQLEYTSNPPTSWVRVWANRYDPRVGWGIPSPIEGASGMQSGGPNVAMDTQGNAVAAWIRTEFIGIPKICTNRYEPGIGWGAVERIVSDNTGDVSSPAVSLDPAGNAIVVWRNYFIDPKTLWANRYGILSGWGSPRSIGSDNNIYVFDVKVGMDASGIGIVAWTQSEFPAETVRTNRFVPGAGWSSPDKINTGDGISMRRIRLAVSACGDAFAVWEQFGPSGTPRVWATRYGAPAR